VSDGTSPASRSSKALPFVAAAVLALVGAAYANHFSNGFHFDDAHSIVGNPFIRDLRNVPRFFTDATTFSSLPANQAYRPLLLVSYALDVRLGGGVKPFQFHLTNFLLLLCQAAAMVFLFRRLLARAAGERLAPWLALFGAGLFAVHTAVAETVNYISARSDLLSTCLVVLAFTAYAARGRLRRWGVYLLLFVLAALVKPVVLVFPVLLFAYRLLLEPADQSGSPPEVRWRRSTLATAALAAAPALALTVALGWLHARMTPPTFTPSATPRFAYAMTQPYVMLRYFRRFLLPTDLSADSDLAPLPSGLEPRALAGFAFLAALAAAIALSARRTATRPVSFGLLWFVVAALPTSSFFPLAEVENDHRLFFPFVGLTLAAAAAIGLLVRRWEPALVARRPLRVALGAAACAVLLAHGWGVHERNRVWRDEASLWRDVTIKSPNNGRGWMNYGLTQMQRGRLDAALACFERARALVPNYSYLHTNIGIALAAEGRTTAAEDSFKEGVHLAGSSAEPWFYYARFLDQQGRRDEALAAVRQALALSPAHIDARHLLLKLLAANHDEEGLERAAQEALAIWPEDSVARAYARGAASPSSRTAARVSIGSAGESAEALLERSLAEYRAGRWEACIATCRAALSLRPDYAEAYNNVCAADNALGRWDDAIAACTRALELSPSLELAKNNLEWARRHKASESR
jgi:tetratricopeptide (TPR) repeat protein